MSYYSVNLPSYTIGEGCYKEIPHTTRFYGKTAVVIGGKIAMSKAKDKILEGIKDSDVEILDFIWYGGDSTYENGNALIDMDVVKKADMIFAVGGGRACDTCKYVANEMDKKLNYSIERISIFACPSTAPYVNVILVPSSISFNLFTRSSSFTINVW